MKTSECLSLNPGCGQEAKALQLAPSSFLKLSTTLLPPTVVASFVSASTRTWKRHQRREVQPNPPVLSTLPILQQQALLVTVKKLTHAMQLGSGNFLNAGLHFIVALFHYVSGTKHFRLIKTSEVYWYAVLLFQTQQKKVHHLIFSF